MRKCETLVLVLTICDLKLFITINGLLVNMLSFNL